MTRASGLLLAWLAIAVTATGHASAAAAQRDSTPDSTAAAHRAVIDRYCVTCHNQRSKIPAANPLLLDTIDLADLGARAEIWEKVVRKLRTDAMPPAGAPRPEPAVSDRLASWLESRLDQAAVASPNPGRAPAVRRLTRTEYRNAVRDLLALEDLPKELDVDLLLPADNTVGFDTVAELLFVTPTLMEGYVTAARKISRVAVGDPTLPLIVDTYRLPLELPQDDQLAELPFGTRGGALIRRHFPVDGEYLIKVELAGAAREPHDLEVTIDGERVGLFPIGFEQRRQTEYEDDRDAAPQLRIPVRAGPRTVAVTFVKKTSAANEALVRPYRRSRGALPSVAAVTISGPQEPSGAPDTPTRRRLFVCRPATASAEEACARRILLTLTRRAYRRAVANADVDEPLRFYREGRAEGGFDTGIQRALERVLVSPEFLLRAEYPRANASRATAYAVTDVELASRLSFFLWSSIPDDELLTVAVEGRLRSPGMLQQQVQRMLKDERADALVSNFAAQWLYLRDLQARRPNDRMFPDFDDGLRQALLRETELFFGSILREDRSAVDLLKADYTFLNQRLAQHYGIPNVYGSHFRRVTLGPESVRAGLLGQGSVLTLTSYATRTSPVVRGKWILENILGAPPPPPPPNVPALKETTDGGKVLTMRDRMAQHRTNAVCASCHARMDPLGFALENFDAVGRWRTRDESGSSIDASGVLPEGTKFDGIKGLRQVLLARPELFVTTLTEKLLTYAVGRQLGYADAPAVRGIVRAAAGSDYHFSSVIAGIVSSTPFQMRQP
jgi:mono/diheme cytochrome c family protein